MTDSSNLYDSDLPALRSRLQADGYILLRNQIDPKLIDGALNVVADNLAETWQCIDMDPDHHPQPAQRHDLFIKEQSEGILLTGYRPITHHEAVQSLLHCDDLVTLMHSLFGQEPMTYDTKWVRVKGTNESTDEHSDYYRFAEHCTQMVTAWMPLMDVPVHKGPLAVCPGSHLLIDGDGDGDDGQYGMDQKECELPADFETFHESTCWKTCDFKKGDILIFDIRLVHASLTNQTKQFRVSIDTRWQPRSVVTLIGDSFVRFQRYLKRDLDGKEVSCKEMKGGDQMMDCSISESDDDGDSTDSSLRDEMQEMTKCLVNRELEEIQESGSCMNSHDVKQQGLTSSIQSVFV